MSLLSALEGAIAELERNERAHGPPPIRIECGQRVYESIRTGLPTAEGERFDGLHIVVRYDLAPLEYAVVFSARKA